MYLILNTFEIDDTIESIINNNSCLIEFMNYISEWCDYGKISCTFNIKINRKDFSMNIQTLSAGLGILPLDKINKSKYSFKNRIELEGIRYFQEIMITLKPAFEYCPHFKYFKYY